MYVTFIKVGDIDQRYWKTPMLIMLVLEINNLQVSLLQFL